MVVGGGLKDSGIDEKKISVVNLEIHNYFDWKTKLHEAREL
jgi:hypothetical protein